MTKVVFNNCFGGFGLSNQAACRLAQLRGEPEPELDNHHHDERNGCRHDPNLVQVVEELGDEASGPFAKLNIADVSSDRYWIEEYDGSETVWTPETLPWVNVGDDK